MYGRQSATMAIENTFTNKGKDMKRMGSSTHTSSAHKTTTTPLPELNFLHHKSKIKVHSRTGHEDLELRHPRCVYNINVQCKEVKTQQVVIYNNVVN